jgi:Uma2 family endonuclease
MATLIVESVRLQIPVWVKDIDSFRRWTDEDSFPESGHIWWLRGEVWADMSKEQIFTHNAVKTEITAVLHRMAKADELGQVFSDGILLTNYEADVSGNPDLTFIARASFESGRVRLVKGAQGGYVEVRGSPDLVVEVLSDGSEKKDLDVLRQAYWEAGIHEYWIVDAREEPLTFDILRHTARGYAATSNRDGWVKSKVFGRSFRLRQATGLLGHPGFTLDAK